MYPSRTSNSASPATLGRSAPLPPQPGAYNLSTGLRPSSHAVLSFNASGHVDQPRPPHVHSQPHHLYQNFVPEIPPYTNRVPVPCPDRISCGQTGRPSSMPTACAPHPNAWYQSANVHTSRLLYPNPIHMQAGGIRPEEKPTHGVCYAPSPCQQATRYSVPQPPVIPGTECPGTTDSSGSVNSNHPVHLSNSTRPGMRVVLPSGPVHTSKRNPPPPPPPRSGSWLAGGVTNPETSSTRDPSTLVHPAGPSELPHMHLAASTTPLQRHHPAFPRQQFQPQHQQQQQPQVPPSAVHLNAHPDATQSTTSQWGSVNYPVYVNGHRAAPETEAAPNVSAVHHPTERGSPNANPCYRNAPRADHSSSSSVGHNPSRFVHRALPPPVPGSNGNRLHEPDHHHQQHHLPANHNNNNNYPSNAPRLVVIDALLRFLVYHYTEPEPQTGVGSGMEDSRTVLDRLYHALCTNPGRLTTHHDRIGTGGVVSLARRLLPHLIRIAYTELVSNDDDSWADHRAATQEKVNAYSGSDSKLNSDGTDQGGLSVNGLDVSMTASMESRHSCADEEEAEDGTYADEPRDTFDPAANGLTVRAELDALPPGTSLTELKSAALEAILRLVPVYQTDGSLCERDVGIVRLLATIHTYSTTQTSRIERLRALQAATAHPPPHASVPSATPSPIESTPRCPVAEVAALVRLSFHPEHRTAICELGGVHALIALLRCEQTLWSDPALHLLRSNQLDYAASLSGSRSTPPTSSAASTATRPGAEHLLETSLALRRYICMALTNLTYGVAANKALLCRRLANLEALLAQMEIGNEELKQVSASVLRNLSWRTDLRSKLALRRVNAPRRLTLAAMTSHRDSTLRTTLSALWNLSAHCSHNKRAVCSVDGVFAFLLRTMHCDDLNSRLVIVENSGGILRNISAVVAGREDYRMLLNKSNCYPILIELLRHSPSLTVVVNVCGTLWNLTTPATCPAEDLVALCRLGVIDLLHMLARSPHELIRNSSTAVLRNLMHPNQIPTPAATTITSQAQSGTTTTTTSTNTVQSNGSSATEVQPVTESDDGSTTEQATSNQTAEQLYRRRVSARSRLPFGLLSVVLEADDDDEEAAENESDGEVTEDEDDEGDNTETDDLVASIYAHGEPDPQDRSQEELAIDDPTGLLLHPDTAHPDTELEPSDCWAQLDPGSEDEQTRVYAEEGTPFPPDSASASCLELHEPQVTGPSADTQAVKNSPTFPVITSYHSNDMLPHVYSLEDSPFHHPGGASPCDPSRASDLVAVRESGMEPLGHDDGPCLPSPPPDVSSLIPSLHQLQLDEDFEGNTTGGFNLPPPPPPPPAVAEPDTESDFIQTPLIFSRGTSSYLSSGPLGASPGAFQSSPQSECSDPAGQGDGNSGRLTDLELETGAGSKCIISPVDSVIEEPAAGSFYPKPDASVAESEGPIASVGIHADEDDEEEVRLPFAEEGTPQDAISFVEDSAVNGRVPCTSFDWHERQINAVGVRRVEEEDDEPGQAQILQQCIASAMPGNSSYAPLRTDFPNSIPASATFAPDINRTVAFVEDEDNDSVRNFAVEDTPFGTSTKASSLSDLIVSEQKSSAGELFADSSSGSHQNCGPLPQSNHLLDEAQHSVDRGSSSSSINGETSSDLLSEVIQSAMPKSVQTTTCDSRIPITRTTTVTSTAATADGDCLQLYALEGTPGAEDLSGSSSVHDVCESAINSFTSQSSSLHGLPATSPALASASYSTGSLETAAVPVPPTPPRRTTSVLSNQRDPFAPNPAPNRPQATVAPMPQVARCPPTIRSNNVDQRTSEADFSDVEKTTTPGRDLITSGLLANGTDKDDASSFSSLLSIESVGLEHSLLQECISSAMPRPKVSGMLRKPQQLWNQLRSDLCLDESLPEQDEPHLSSGIPQSAELLRHESEAVTKSDQPETSMSAPVTQRASVHGCSSGESSLCSSTHPNSVPETHKPDTGATNHHGSTSVQSDKSGTAIHFLEDGSDGALPRLPCSSSLATKSWTSPRLAQANSYGAGAKGNVSASSELNVSSGVDDPPKSTHPVQPISRPASNLPVFGSRIPSVSGRTSGLPRATRMPTSQQQQQQQPRSTAFNRSAENKTSAEKVEPDILTNLLAEGAEAVLAELRNTTTAAGPAVNTTHNSQPDASSSDSNSLELLPSEDVDSLFLIPDALPDSCNRQLSSAITTESQAQNKLGQKPKPPAQPDSRTAKSRLVQPLKLARPSNTSDRSRTSTIGGIRTNCSPSTPPTQIAKPSSGAYGSSRRAGPTSTSPLTSRTTRVGSTKPSGLRAPSSLSAPRTAMTCPPSATIRSLASSRSSSTTGSVNNLVSASGAKTQHRSHAVSAQSVCAALNKRERTVAVAKPIVRPQQTATTHVKPQSSYSSSSSSSIPSRVQHSTGSTYALRAGTIGTNLSTAGNSASSSCSNLAAPKPIRGGRKSLTGRKPDSHLSPNTVNVKPVYKPKQPLSQTVTDSMESVQNGISTVRSTNAPSSSTSCNTTRAKKATVTGMDSLPDSAIPNGVLPDSTHENANGMWIVRGELGLVNGLK